MTRHARTASFRLCHVRGCIHAPTHLQQRSLIYSVKSPQSALMTSKEGEEADVTSNVPGSCCRDVSCVLTRRSSWKKCDRSPDCTKISNYEECECFFPFPDHVSCSHGVQSDAETKLLKKKSGSCQDVTQADVSSCCILGLWASCERCSRLRLHPAACVCSNLLRAGQPYTPTTRWTTLNAHAHTLICIHPTLGAVLNLDLALDHMTLKSRLSVCCSSWSSILIGHRNVFPLVASTLTLVPRISHERKLAVKLSSGFVK